MAVGLSPMKPLHAAPMRLDFSLQEETPTPHANTAQKCRTIAQKGQSKSCLKLFLPFAEKSEKIAP